YAGITKRRSGLAAAAFPSLLLFSAADMETVHGALERELRPAEVDFVLARAGQALLGAGLGGLRPFHVDVARQFRALGENDDLLLANFHEAALDGDDRFLAVLLDSSRRNLQRRD